LALKRTCELVSGLGRHLEHVGDAPGLVLGRIICQLINEAAFVVGEGNGTPEDVDAGLELGANHPRGPVSWSKEIGLTHIEAVLTALHRERGDDRYRVAPLLHHQRALGAEGLSAL
jgi:3-hydroxybutyryl-CoA dehydrogenase